MVCVKCRETLLTVDNRLHSSNAWGMSGYTKLFTTILDSTIWQESKETRLVWITMLAMKDKQQIVQASVPGLAKRAGVEVTECEVALARLKAPDPYSRTKAHEGRRVEEVEGGWLILNGAKYRELMSREDRREYQRVKQAEYRRRKKKPVESEGERGVADLQQHADNGTPMPPIF